MEFDELDFKILLQLKQNAKQSLSVLEEKLDKRSSTIHSRIKKLEAKNIIRNYSINLNYKELGFPLVAFIMLSFDKHETNFNQEAVAKHLAGNDNRKWDELEELEKIKYLDQAMEKLIKQAYEAKQESKTDQASRARQLAREDGYNWASLSSDQKLKYLEDAYSEGPDFDVPDFY